MNITYYASWLLLLSSIFGMTAAPLMKNAKKGTVLSILSLIVFLLSLRVVLLTI